MRIALLMLCCASVARSQVSLTYSTQKSPTPLPKGLALVSITACSSSTRVVSAAQIFAASPWAFQDPSLYPGLMTKAASRTPASIALTASKYTATGISIGTGVESYLKSQDTNTSNASTYEKISIIGGVLGVALAIAQPVIQGDVNAQQATITAGVQAALMTEADLYSIPPGGCANNPHRMFYATGATGTTKGVIP
jgi:hypothetical protein